MARPHLAISHSLLSDPCLQLALLATQVIHLLHVNSINEHLLVTHRYILLEQLDVHMYFSVHPNESLHAP